MEYWAQLNRLPTDYAGSTLQRLRRPTGLFRLLLSGVNNLATMTLAPAGTPLWTPQKDDFAPRLGIAWNPRSDLVIRAGAGIFYDLGYSEVANGISEFPYVQEKIILGTSFPLSGGGAAPPPFPRSTRSVPICGGGPESRIT